MPPLALQLAFTPWTLATDDGEIRITPQETCIRDQCVETGTPTTTYGAWSLHDLRIRWTFNDRAIVREGSGPWTPARLTTAGPATGPPRSLHIAPVHDGDWAPGLWREATLDCDRARPVWIFDSIVRDGTDVVAIPGPHQAWTVRPGATLYRCDDEKGPFSGVSGRTRRAR